MNNKNMEKKGEEGKNENKDIQNIDLGVIL
jgi:hypothetical protein